MNKNGMFLIVLGFVGIGVYLYVSSKPRQAEQTSNPSTGQTAAAPQDLFSSILGTIKSAITTIQIAQTNPKTT